MAYALHQRQAGQRQKATVTYGSGCGCAGMSVNERHLTEEITFFKEGKSGLLRVLRPAYLNSAGLDDEHGVAGVTLIEDDFTFPVRDAKKFPALAHDDTVRAHKYSTLFPPLHLF